MISKTLLSDSPDGEQPCSFFDPEGGCEFDRFHTLAYVPGVSWECPLVDLSNRYCPKRENLAEKEFRVLETTPRDE